MRKKETRSSLALSYLKRAMDKSFIQINHSTDFIGVLVQDSWKKVLFSRALKQIQPSYTFSTIIKIIDLNTTLWGMLHFVSSHFLVKLNVEYILHHVITVKFFLH